MTEEKNLVPELYTREAIMARIKMFAYCLNKLKGETFTHAGKELKKELDKDLHVKPNSLRVNKWNLYYQTGVNSSLLPWGDKGFLTVKKVLDGSAVNYPGGVKEAYLTENEINLGESLPPSSAIKFEFNADCKFSIRCPEEINLTVDGSNDSLIYAYIDEKFNSEKGHTLANISARITREPYKNLGLEYKIQLGRSVNTGKIAETISYSCKHGQITLGQFKALVEGKSIFLWGKSISVDNPEGRQEGPGVSLMYKIGLGFVVQSARKHKNELEKAGYQKVG